MERVLVAGGSGFIGRAVVECLDEAGAEVTYASRHPIPGYAGRAGFRELDLLASDDFDRAIEEIAPTTLLHFGWTTETGVYWTSPANHDWVTATAALAESFARAGGRRLVVAGSCAEYDWHERRLEEQQSPLSPANLYGRAKASLFEMLQDAAPELGISFAWGRIFFPFGPREKADRLIPSVVNGLLAGRPIPLTEGTQVLDFMHVRDVAQAFVAIAGSDVQGAVNVASGTPRSVRSVVTDFAERLDGLELLRFGDLPQRPGPIPRMEASIERLTNEIGFIPSLNWSTAIDDTIAWWRANPPSA